MSFIMRCDACGRKIDADPGEAIPKDRTAFVELQASDDPNRRRHYHRTPQCWDTIKAAILEAEAAAQAAR